jgi:hypothetical protein
MAVSRYQFPFLLCGKGRAMPMDVLLHGAPTLYWCIGTGLRIGGLSLLSRCRVVGTTLYFFSMPSVLLSDFVQGFVDDMMLS